MKLAEGEGEGQGAGKGCLKVVEVLFPFLKCSQVKKTIPCTGGTR